MQKLMTVEELREYLGFSSKTIYRLLKQDDIPKIRIGNKWRFDKEAVDRWLQVKAPGQPASILVIDDDPMIRALFEETLQSGGRRVVAVGSGHEGIEKARREDFDLVFLDLRMPGMSGVEILHQIKLAKPDLPVVIISGYPDSDLMAHALSHGPVIVMIKPFGADEILEAVNTYLIRNRT